MGPDLTETPRTTACPSCGATLRADAPWCTLCYTDLRPKPEPVPEPSAPLTTPVGAAYGRVQGDPLTQPLLEFLPVASPAPEAPTPPPTPASAISWPCTECETANPLSAASCTVCGAGFLAAVASQGHTSLVLPVIGDLGRLSRQQRLAVAFGAVCALLVPLALITLLLTGSPPKNGVTTVGDMPTSAPVTTGAP